MPTSEVSIEKTPPASTGAAIPSDARAHHSCAQFHVDDSDGHTWLVTMENGAFGLTLRAFYTCDKVTYEAPIGKVIDFLKSRETAEATP